MQRRQTEPIEGDLKMKKNLVKTLIVLAVAFALKLSSVAHACPAGVSFCRAADPVPEVKKSLLCPPMVNFCFAGDPTTGVKETRLCPPGAMFCFAGEPTTGVRISD